MKPYLDFSAVVIKEDDQYTALCLDLDIASQGESIQQAKDMLLEAVTLYLETAFDNNQPYLRHVPPEDDPRRTASESIIETFTIKATIGVQVYA